MNCYIKLISQGFHVLLLHYGKSHVGVGRARQLRASRDLQAVPFIHKIQTANSKEASSLKCLFRMFVTTVCQDVPFRGVSYNRFCMRCRVIVGRKVIDRHQLRRALTTNK